MTTALEKLSQFFQRHSFQIGDRGRTTAACNTPRPASAATVSVVFNAALQAAPCACGFECPPARFASLTKVQTAVVCVAIAAAPVAWQISERRDTQAALVHAKTQLTATQNEFSVVQTEIQRLNESTTQLDESLTNAREAAAQHRDHPKVRGMEAADAGAIAGGGLSVAGGFAVRADSQADAAAVAGSSADQATGRDQTGSARVAGVDAGRARAGGDGLAESFLGNGDLMESNRYETNAATLAHQSKDVLAGRVFGVPALGDAAKQKAEELSAALKTVLGAERWPMVEEQLKYSGGTDNLNLILNLSAAEKGRIGCVGSGARWKAGGGFRVGDQRTSSTRSSGWPGALLARRRVSRRHHVGELWGVRHCHPH